MPYLDDPPSPGELGAMAAMAAMAGLQVRQMLRVSEPEVSDLSLDDAAVPDARLLETMHQNPRLIERPIFVHRGRAVIGRPPERVLELLE